MNTTNLHTASLDEIIFEGRNKAYGAFVLRQLYNRHLARALAITVTLALLLVSITLVMQRFFPAALPSIPQIVEKPVDLTYIAPPKPPKAIATPKPTITQPQPVVVTPHADVAPRVVKDDLVTKPMVTTEPSLINDNTLIEGKPGGDAISGPSSTVPGTDSGTTTAPPPSKPFVHVEVMPEFAGGINALRKYMQSNLRYPKQALANAVSGKVFVSFTVQADGSISDVQVLKGLGYGTDEEAARVVSSMPSWTPGRQNSRPVAVRYTMPITFQYQ
ncbi:energy transducer TonB [Hymenobacter cellulosivorans]|uniref:TonB family protein n=1 Tax=Hymenobacter cellulosivorans TaxID=2932249 RepID=A0ABY4FD03_9BACT|nr:energy transducer TonB [Hymenobacter cellulosivorans]UOQ54547.1 TonB family protein [Hymenobacter cellulosivorans]